MSSIPNDLAIAILRELRNLREDIESKQALDWSDIGFTGDEEARLNRQKPRFSKDIQLTALLDPTTDPMSIVAPASSSSVTKDPFANIGGIEWNYTQTAKTSPRPITLTQAFATATNTYVSLESPAGTDYSVPVGKEFMWLKLKMLTGATNLPTGNALTWGYGDTGVAEGTSAPTTEVDICYAANVGPAYGTNTIVDILAPMNNASPFPISDPTGQFLGIVPAGKFPFVRKAAAGIFGLFGWGLEGST